MASNIIAPTPVLTDPKDQTEVRKALTDMTRDINNNITDLQSSAASSSSTTSWIPYPAGDYVFPSGTINVAEGIAAIGAQTTAPTFPAGTKRLWYRTSGKTIDIRVDFQATSAVGAANGSGLYYIGPPRGMQFDTTNLVLSTSDYSGTNYGVLGLGFNTGGNFTGSLSLVPISTTLLAFMGHYTGSAYQNGRWSSTMILMTNFPGYISGVAIGIPIQ